MWQPASTFNDAADEAAVRKLRALRLRQLDEICKRQLIEDQRTLGFLLVPVGHRRGHAEVHFESDLRVVETVCVAMENDRPAIDVW